VASARLGPADVSGAEYRVLTGTLGGYRLSVGTSLRNVNDVADIVVVALAWAIAGFALVVGIIGLLAASSGQRRLDSIATTMGLVARGDLKARIPLSGRGDDIDELVGSVNAALDRLAALVEGMRQVSTDIAHELKTPLNRLSIAVANATEAAGEASELSPLLDEAQNEIRQVISIFDAMLRIAQIEAGARRARFGPVQLGNILENVAEAYGPVAADNGQRLTLAINDTLGCVDGDKDLLTQAIANLLENALRHCPQGTLITLEGRIESGHPTVTVADTGPGIPDADKPRVFDRLYRVEKSRTTQGNGLGLSLVKAVADLHNATIALADNYPGLIVKIVFECRES
jgi:signal transduction histidine kinase